MTDLYEVRLEGAPWVAAITGPGVEGAETLFLHQSQTPREGTEAVARALQAAYAAGASQSASDLDRAGRKNQALEAENIRLNSQLNQIILGGMAGGQS